MPPDDVGGTGRARDGGYDGSRSQDSVTVPHGWPRGL